MFEFLGLLGDLANLKAPDNRREIAVFLLLFGVLLTTVFGGAFIAEAAESAASLETTFLALPIWMPLGSAAGLLLILLGAALYAADARIE